VLNTRNNRLGIERIIAIRGRARLRLPGARDKQTNGRCRSSEAMVKHDVLATKTVVAYAKSAGVA
jgi:hypothetical protein